jgi:xanthine/CO dehydrogenase XdhC/CoxF family maturation factor
MFRIDRPDGFPYTPVVRKAGGVGVRAILEEAIRLLEKGQCVKKADLERIHSPIGLSIKAAPPTEIAVRITAELIRIRAELNG